MMNNCLANTPLSPCASFRMCAWLMLFILWLLPTAMQATYVDESYNYSIIYNAPDKIKMKLALYDADGADCWVYDGNVYVTVDGSTKTLLHYAAEADIDNDHTYNDAKFSTGVAGKVMIMRGVDYGNEVVSTSERTIKIYRPSTRQTYFSVDAEWTIPNELRGKTLKFTYSVKRYGNARSHLPVEGLQSMQYDISAMEALVIPDMMTPMLSYERANAGKIMVPWMVAAGNIQSVTLYYTDSDGKTHSSELEKVASSFVYVPDDKPIRNCYIKVVYQDSEKKLRTTQSVPVDLPILHVPRNLQAQLQADGSAILTWTVEDPLYKDVMDADMWEIQRSIGAPLSDSDWHTVGQITYIQGTKSYSFVDEMLFSAYESGPVFYRVRRSSTAVWGWSEAAGMVMAEISQRYYLPFVGEAFATKAKNWGLNGKHEVNITWSMCSTPLDNYDLDGNFILRSSEDWETFASLVNGGKTRLNAVMYADIALGESQTMVGTARNPYRGKFNGNGHTLTFKYAINSNSNVADQNLENHPVAPFAFVGNLASFKDIHTVGSITTNFKFAGGLIGKVLDENLEQQLVLENCWSSVTINSSCEGDGTHGGLIGVVMMAEASGKSLTLTNCLFDGLIIGKNTHSWGGFVGWTYLKRHRYLHCLVAPKFVEINPQSSCTFARSYYSPDISHSYYTREVGSSQGSYRASTTDSDLQKLLDDLNSDKVGMGWKLSANGVVPVMSSVDYENKVNETYTPDGRFILRDAKDWEAFANMVNGGQTNLNAVMVDDIDLGTSQTMIGSKQNPYKGQFNGRGHTLTYAYTASGEYCAPFLCVDAGAYVENLHVKGSIDSPANYVGGLIGLSNPSRSSTVYVENCVVDAQIKSSHGMGGIVGESKGNLGIDHCAFYGSLETTDTYAQIGGIIGWGAYGTTQYVTNVLFAPRQFIVPDRIHNRSYIFVCTDPTMLTLSLTNCLYTNKVLPANADAIDASSMTAADIAQKMGTKWTVFQDRAMPTAAISNNGELPTDDIALWDERAKIEIHTAMIAASGEIVHTSERELTAAEVKEGSVTLPLTNTCVDYQFNLTVKRGNSPLYIGLKSRQSSYSSPVTKTEKGDDASYEFNLNGQVTGVNATEQQASVQLNWTTNNQAVDYFRVLRRDKADTTNKVDTLVTNYQQTQYTDLHPRPQHTYVYRVEAVVDCEGQHLTYAETDGHCATTGMVQGYVRLSDGTAVAGAKVVAAPSKASDITDGVTKTAVTDESGFFQIGGLVYQKAGTYIITVTRKGEEGQVGSRNVDFTDDSNLTSDFNFYVQDYCTYAGVVLYAGTSIPVLGAQFKLDGNLVTKSSGPDKGKPVTTNSAGEFSISVPLGSHSVQVVKPGHVFANRGFLIKHDTTVEEDSTYNFTKNISQEFLWDQTRVILRGRVVGGKDQGSLPLGKSLSHNNLGDSIRIVMSLEGDNTSWIVRDQKDETIHMRDSLYYHGRSDTTRVVSTRHSIVISPDNKTGEFQLPFFPVKYKVTEIYCNGYATLFQAGTVGETLDLSDKVLGDTVTYNRIYHKPATLAYEQFTGTQERYYGIKNYKAQDNLGHEATVQLWKNGIYSLGHPVFMANSPALLTLSAREEYYYNNVVKDTPDDIVLLSGGKVYIHNGLISTTHTDSLSLDEEGKASYLFTPQNLTFVSEGDKALKSLTFTLLYDATYYDIKPLKAYVMASLAKSQGKRLLMAGMPHLVDILRDPPGSSSSTYMEEGSKLKYGYNYNFSIEGGFNLSLSQGQGSDFYTGVWAGEGSGSSAGNINKTSSNSLFDIGITLSYYGGWNYAYDMETKQQISTASGIKNVGAAADLYIGTTDETVVEEAIAVRVVPESMYKLLVPATGNTFTIAGKTYEVALNTVKKLAEGVDADGNKVYLIRDEVLQAAPRFKSTFVYSQTHIENELLPQLMRVRQSLMLPVGTSDAEAQAQATRLKHPVYVSKVPLDDAHYASIDDKGARTYIQFVPQGSTLQWTDSIMALNQEMMAWIGFLTVNEQEKLSVSESDKVKTFSFDGAGKIDYAESFSFSLERENYMKIPGISDGNFLGDTFFDNLVKNFKKRNYQEGHTTEQQDDEGNVVEVGFQAAGKKTMLTFKPILSYNFNYKNTKEEEHSKKTGFTLSCDRKAFLTVDVYRTKVDLDDYKKKIAAGDMSVIYQYSEETKEAIRSGATGTNGALSFMPYDAKTYSNFVFRTRAGATKKPYEPARYSQFYNRGTLIDVETLPIDNLKIWTDQATVSNVPYGEPAKFTIHIANESEVPNLVSPFFELFRADNEENGKGAKIFVDGTPLTGSGITVWLKEHEQVDKQVEVYAGTEFDYDNLTISLWDPEDEDRICSQRLSAHFLPSAGKVNISSPSDKWVINTASPYNKDKKLYYMPVRIDEFNVNARGFDHIELQYKLSTEGDKSWVNVCSYYKSEELMALASGERKLIKNDGYIDDAIFYGEKDPVEQNYDIRAVVYCRHAGGFITSSSPILSGVKDTRIPVPFGTPKPVTGILDMGDDIIVSFSEPIAGNYLSKVNNFEVIGTTNSTNISLSTALRFMGGESYGFTQADRNLDNKSFTFDLMLNPDNNGKNMMVLSHGDMASHLRLGVTADRRLLVKFDGKTAISDQPVRFNNLHQVAYSFDQSTEGKTVVTFYDGSEEIGKKTLEAGYHGSGSIWLGNDFYEEEKEDPLPLVPYEGSMLELRLWNTAISPSQLAKYSQKVLTGYELNLIDNYALNEGKGVYSYDKAVGGNDIMLSGTNWIVPEGISLKLDGKTGVRMKTGVFDREDFEDYTLMFWFRTNDKEGTLMSNGLAKDEANNGMHFFVGVESGELVFRSAGQEVKTETYVSDGAWHHFAVTVNRSRNVGNLYIDQKMVESFAVEKFGGISGGKLLAVGATYPDEATPTLALTGNIDEIAMYEMVLPENLLQTYSQSTPTGEEMGTLVYLPFSRTERMADNRLRLMPTGISLRLYKVNGAISETRRDTIMDASVVTELADRLNYALMLDNKPMENLAYSYVVDGQQLLLNLDEPDASIEKTNVYITVKEVADLNGNTTASPVMMNLFVYRNPVRWENKRLDVSAPYGEGISLTVKLKNLGGKSETYSLTGLPIWMTASKTAGTLPALGEEVIELTISPYINIGDFREKIFLVGSNGMSEPLPIYIKIRGEAPKWAVSDALKSRNLAMHMVARIKVENEVRHDAEDMVAVYGEGHQLLGVAHVDVDQTAAANEALTYLTIYNSGNKPTPLSFEFYNASTGRIYVLEPDKEKYPDSIKFEANSVVGSSADPVVLSQNLYTVQTLYLNKGWNWLSFYVSPDTKTVTQLLNESTSWEAGDGFEVINSNGEPYVYTYKSKPHPDDPNQRIYFWDHGSDVISVNSSFMYRFYSKSEKTAYLSGLDFPVSITLHKGWNRIAFSSPINLPLSVALSDYTDKASEGDIIKSQDEFAVLNIVNGNRLWKGSLKYMRSGEGYMLKRNNDKEASFWYPSYWGASRYAGRGGTDAQMRQPLYINPMATSMSVIAVTEGVDLQEGDRLVAYHGAEVCGVAEADADGHFYLSVAESDSRAMSDVTFSIEREGELVGLANQRMSYVSDAVVGSVDEPTVINFVSADSYADGGWYTLEGIRLSGRPAEKGVYIFNGTKVLVK